MPAPRNNMPAPDAPEFTAAARSPKAAEDQRFVDAISDWPDA